MDYNEAMTCKGVITYIDSKDIPGNKFITDDELLFATEKVCISTEQLWLLFKVSYASETHGQLVGSSEFVRFSSTITI